MKDFLTNSTSSSILFVILAGFLLLSVIFQKPLRKYIKESVAELKKTNWPTKERVEELFVVVIVISLVFAVMVGVFDLGFSKIFGKILENEFGF